MEALQNTDVNNNNFEQKNKEIITPTSNSNKAENDMLVIFDNENEISVVFENEFEANFIENDENISLKNDLEEKAKNGICTTESILILDKIQKGPK